MKDLLSKAAVSDKQLYKSRLLDPVNEEEALKFVSPVVKNKDPSFGTTEVCKPGCEK